MSYRPILSASFLLIICLAPAVAGDAKLPHGGGSMTIPAGWTEIAGTSLILRGPGKEAIDAPRLAVEIAAGDIASTTDSLRDGYRRLADGCEIIDDDQVPLGGRVWSRLRVRFAAGPLAFGQSAWVGTVGSRTVVVVLSAPDDSLAVYLAAASSAIASISAPR
jgi:hypothetical protein